MLLPAITARTDKQEPRDIEESSKAFTDSRVMIFKGKGGSGVGVMLALARGYSMSAYPPSCDSNGKPEVWRLTGRTIAPRIGETRSFFEHMTEGPELNTM